MQLQEMLVEERRPSVEIMETSLLVHDNKAAVVTEREPFSISVHVRADRIVPVADVSIKLMRSDGVYVFWQSSGMDGANLRDLSGERTVLFRFDPNCFGAGTYLVSAYVANGWDLRENYPSSEVYCRAIDALKFEVAREEDVLDMGVVNTRVRVDVL